MNGEPKLKITGDINDLNMEASVSGSGSENKMTSTLTSDESIVSETQDFKAGE